MKTSLKAAATAIVLMVFAGSAAAEVFRKPGYYSVDATGWVHGTGPHGDLFACQNCPSRVQLQLEYGPPLPADSPYKTNREFLARLKTEDTQKQFADLMLQQSLPPNLDLEVSVDQVRMTQIGGLDAFEFSALVNGAPQATREHSFVAIHKNRIMKLTLDYFENGMDEATLARIGALLKSLKFN